MDDREMEEMKPLWEEEHAFPNEQARSGVKQAQARTSS